MNLPHNKASALDRSTRHAFCFRKSRAERSQPVTCGVRYQADV